MNIRPLGQKSRKHQKKTGVLTEFAVAIVEPEFGLNVGYVARTAANFGIDRLFIISRRKLSVENFSKAELYAAHGKYLIKNLQYLPSVESLKRKFKVLVGTTAIEARRKSNLTRKNLGPEECATMVISNLSKSKKPKACFVFGRDTTGLTNEELKLCDYNLTIRTYSDYNTLNISHAAAIVFFTFANIAAVTKLKREEDSPHSSSTATRKERERVVSLFLKLAEDSEFQAFKINLLRQSIERVLNRSDPSLRELYLLMGLASRADSKIRRQAASEDRLFAG
jgi:tRNA/rRNA methyltransferase